MAVGVGGGWGLWQGYLIGTAVSLSGDDLDAAATLGLGLGLISGDLFARATDMEISGLVFTELSSYAGSGLGAGIPLLFSGSKTTLVAGMTAAGGWLAKLGTAWIAKDLKFRANDSWEYLFMQGFGTWQGLGFALAADASDRKTQGAALLGLSTGFILPMLSNRYQDFSTIEDLFIFGGASWGTWIAGTGLYALSGQDNSALTAALIGGDIGLLGTAFLLSDLMEVSPRKMGWTQLSGVGGMALGTSLTAIFTSNPRYLAAGISLGSVAGLVSGAIWTGISMRAEEEYPRPAADKQAPKATAIKATEAERENFNFSLGNLSFSEVRPSFFMLPAPADNPKAPAAMIFGLIGQLY